MHKHTFLRLSVLSMAMLASMSTFAFDPNGRIVVKYKPGQLARMAPDMAIRTLGVDAKPIATLSNGAQVLRVPEGQSDATLKRLAAHPGVQYAVRDILVQLSTDDPFYEGDVTLSNGQTYNKYQADLYDKRGGVDAPAAWAQGAKGSGIVVAVIDTGITKHPDLDANVVAGAGYDFMTEAFMSGRASDGRVPGAWDTGDWTHTAPWLGQCRYRKSTFHGTHVSGTIAAVTNNGKGIAGMAHEAKVLPVRVLGHCGGWTSDIADAVTWASGGEVAGVPTNATPAEVVNLSLGGWGACPQYMQDAIDGAVARGSVVVVAAGNSAADVVNATPANCRNVIAVGANGLTGKRAQYSNFGLGITISAPGGGETINDERGQALWIPHGFIWSTGNLGEQGPGQTAIVAMPGTSMAAPHVSAIVAMMQGAATTPHSPAKIASMLVDTARPFPTVPDRALGAGVADAGRAVAAAIAGEAPIGEAKPLYPGTAELDSYAIAGQLRHFVVEVPAEVSRLTLRSFGGAGDADLYVRNGDNASLVTHDAKSVRPGNNGIVVIDAPAAGKYFVALHAAKSYSGVHLRATLE